jgi:hypothetical protein
MHSRVASVCCIMMTIDTCIHISVHFIHGLESGCLSVDHLALRIEQFVQYVNVYSESGHVDRQRYRWFYHSRQSITNNAAVCLVTLFGTHERKAYLMHLTTTHSFESYEASASTAVYAWSTIKPFVPKDTDSIHLMSLRRRLDQGYVGLGSICWSQSTSNHEVKRRHRTFRVDQRPDTLIFCLRLIGCHIKISKTSQCLTSSLLKSSSMAACHGTRRTWCWAVDTT